LDGQLFLILAALEPRFEASPLEWRLRHLQRSRSRPAPGAKAPVLMIHGRYDFVFPLETCQEPLFCALGSPAGDKKRILYDTGHRFAELPIMKAVDWFDHYPGQSHSPLWHRHF